jgi:pre-peptidase
MKTRKYSILLTLIMVISLGAYLNPAQATSGPEDSYDAAGGNDSWAAGLNAANKLSFTTYSNLALYDPDYYNFDATFGTEYTVTLDQSPGSPIMFLRIKHQSGGITLFQVTDGNLHKEITFTASYTGAQIIEVVSSSSYTQQLYNLDIAEAIATDDVYEENDLIGLAKTIPLGKTTDLIQGDTDFYQFNVDAGEQIQLTLEDFTHASNDMNLRLYNSTGSLLGTSATTNNIETIIYNVTTTTAYKAEVYGANNNDTYSLNVTIVDLTPDDIYEENDAYGDAFIISTGKLTGLYQADPDYYILNVPINKNLTITVDNFDSGANNIDIALYNSTNSVTTLATSTTSTSTEQFHHETAYTDLYILEVLGSDTGETYDLNFTIEDIGVADDPHEPNNAPNTPIFIGGGKISNLINNDDDWFGPYTISGPDACINVTLKYDGSLSDLALHLTNSTTGNPEILSNASIGVTENIIYTPAVGEDVYIGVTGWNLGQVYELEIYMLSNDDQYDFASGNDVLNDVSGAIFGFSSESGLKQFDDDYYRIWATAGSWINYTIFSPSSTAPYMQLYNGSSVLLASSNSGTSNIEQILYRVTQDDHYHIYVGGDDSGTEYSMTYNTHPDDNAEPNDNVGSAANFPVGVSQNFIQFNDDFFKFPTTTDNKIHLSLNHSGSSTLKMQLFNSVGDTQLNVTTISGSFGDLWFVAGYTGDYIIKISGDNSSEVYTLRLDIFTPGPPPPEDQYEPNDDDEHAANLAAGIYSTLFLSDANDWFIVNLTAGTKVQINITISVNVSVDLRFLAKAPTGPPILKDNFTLQASDSGTYSFGFNVTEALAGEYFIHLFSNGNPSGIGYTIKFSVENLPAPTNTTNTTTSTTTNTSTTSNSTTSSNSTSSSTSSNTESSPFDSIPGFPIETLLPVMFIIMVVLVAGNKKRRMH